MDDLVRDPLREVARSAPRDRAQGVPGHAGQGVAGQDQAREPVRNDKQQLVAYRMTVCVVDLLEPIEISEEDGGGGVRAPRTLGGVFQPVLQQHAIGQTGQGVVLGVVVEAVGGSQGLIPGLGIEQVGRSCSKRRADSSEAAM